MMSGYKLPIKAEKLEATLAKTKIQFNSVKFKYKQKRSNFYSIPHASLEQFSLSTISAVPIKERKILLIVV